MIRQTLMVALLAAGLSGCAVKQLRADLDAARGDTVSCQDQLAAKSKQLAELESKDDLAAKRLAAYRDLAEKLRAAFDGGDIPIELRNGRLVVLIPNQILFDSGKSTLKPEGKKALDQMAKVLKTVPERRFMIAGHTDNRPVSDKATAFKTNWELSTQRALGAVYHLERAGVKPNRMAAAGYGEHQPVAKNDTDKNRALNRRTELVILPTLDEIPPLPNKI